MNFLEAYDKGDVLIKGQLLGYSGTQRGLAHVDSASLIADVRKPSRWCSSSSISGRT
jgi:polar amino acid transport system ATP-binding protein